MGTSALKFSMRCCYMTQSSYIQTLKQVLFIEQGKYVIRPMSFLPAKQAQKSFYVYFLFLSALFYLFYWNFTIKPPLFQLWSHQLLTIYLTNLNQLSFSSPYPFNHHMKITSLTPCIFLGIRRYVNTNKQKETEGILYYKIIWVDLSVILYRRGSN